jgi:hypothetical protein
MSRPFVDFEPARSHAGFNKPLPLRTWLLGALENNDVLDHSYRTLGLTASYRSVRPRENHIECHGEYCVDE